MPGRGTSALGCDPGLKVLCDGMRSSRRAFLARAAATAATWSLGCNFARRPPRPLRLVVTPWIGNAPLYIAKERRFFGGSDLRIASFGTDFDAWRALADARADFTTGTILDVLRGTDIGVGLKIVAVTDFSNGADGIVSRPSIRTIRDLAGARVAVEIGTLTHFLLIRALERTGLTGDDVKLSNLSTEEAVIALEEERIDAAPLWEPFLSKAIAKGGHLLFTSAEIPGEILDVVAVRSSFLSEEPQYVQLLVNGWEKGLSLLRTNPDEGARLASPYLGTDAKSFHEALKGIHLVDARENQELFDRSRSPSVWTAFANAVAFVQRQGGLTHAPPSAETLFVSGFTPKLGD